MLPLRMLRHVLGQVGCGVGTLRLQGLSACCTCTKQRTHVTLTALHDHQVTPLSSICLYAFLLLL